MQCKWLQIFCLCAAIQFQYIVGNNVQGSVYSNGQPRNVGQIASQYKTNTGMGMGTSNGAQKNIESTTAHQDDYETTVYAGGSPNGLGQLPNAPSGQTNSESATNNTGNNRESRQYGWNYYGKTTQQPTRRICTVSTEHYDCQIQDVHLKTGQPSVFGLARNPQQKLTFRDSTLEYLPKSLIDAFPNLTLMDLNNLTIGSIEPDAFLKARNLETVYLEDNRLSNIDRSAFRGAYKLHMLVLTKNYISYIDSNAFDTNTALQHLYLDQNQLNALPAFTNTVYLQFLNASHNRLTSIDGRQFSNLRNLQTLDLSFNRLKRLNLQQLYPNQGLSIDVSFNELTEFIMPPYVTQLNARNNSLTEFEVSQQCFLRSMDLSWNELKKQPTLKTCNLLENLDLSHNSLEAFYYPSNMANLQALNLAHNNLFEFHQENQNLPLSLRALDLSYNELSHGPSLFGFKKLEGVILNDNHLISMKTYVNVKLAPNFKGYRMANNEWSCADIEKFEHLTHDKNKHFCATGMRNVTGICCRDYSKPFNDRLNQVLREADFHDRSNKKNCPKPDPPVSNQKSYLEEIRKAIANVNSEKASKLKEIEKARIDATKYQTTLDHLKTLRNRLNTSKRTLASEIEKQRQNHRVTKEGLISDKEMLERIIKFVQEKDAFNKDLMSRRQKETEDSNLLFDDKQGETDERKRNIANLQRMLADFKQEEKTMKKEKERLEKQVNKNAASIHGGTGRISY